MSPPSFHAIIRADAGGVTGTGHVMRMMALAQALHERGTAVTFVVAICPEVLTSRLRAEGIVVEQLADCEPGSSDDAKQTAALAVTRNARWIILDGYVFDANYQLECRKDGRRLLCVDDHQYGGKWHVDALLNQNLHAPSLRDDYASAAGAAALWLGTDFVLMRKEFWHRPPPTVKRDTGTRRVLVTMGGGDAPNASALIMEALSMVRDLPMRVTVLVGASNPHRPHLESISSRHRDRFEIINAVEDMPSLLKEVDCVITAGGSTCWEVLWAGKPAAVLVIADNQQPIAGALHDQGLMLSLGRIEDASIDRLATQLENWLKKLPTTPLSCVVDGKGAKRVAAALDGSYAITIATAGEGWLRPHLNALKESLEETGHRVQLATKADEMTGGDFLFLLSYWGIVPKTVLEKYIHSLVVHESALPQGRGWSPATWAILEGRNRLPMCLLEAIEQVDRGDIYLRDEIELNGHELIEEWRAQVAARTVHLCRQFIAEFPGIVTRREKQPDEGTYHPRRRAADSRLDPDRTLAAQFNLLRVVDNVNYPAFFEHQGHRYLLKIEKASV